LRCRGRVLFQVTREVGRIEITLEAKKIGDDYLLTLMGGREHVGAVGIGYFDEKNQRASSSVITMPGHREEQLALQGARRVSKATRRTTVIVVGIHQDKISLEEIKNLVSAAEEMIEDFIIFCEKTNLTGRNR
jgi:hypothetical protein